MNGSIFFNPFSAGAVFTRHNLTFKELKSKYKSAQNYGIQLL